MVDDQAFGGFYRGKTVLVTGHTGFKGGWLVIWLKMLGARVVGYALPPDEEGPSLCRCAGVEEDIVSIHGDVRDLESLLSAFHLHQPEVVFHLAAQSLVRASYADPVETHSTNVMGTVHVLEAVRRAPSVRAIVVITSDKCYENREWAYAYRENDPLGGHDPYSASKAAAEIVTASYRRAYFPSPHTAEGGVGVASARAGNVLGGGDWSMDRLLPDCVRALVDNEPIPVRNPDAVRPWQHVLEPLSGYLWLGARLCEEPGRYGGAWNFGPDAAGHATVRDIVRLVCEEWDERPWDTLDASQKQAPHETTFLKLDCSKTAGLLRWYPVWTFRECIRQTTSWYRCYYTGAFNAATYSQHQVQAFVRAAQEAGTAWAEVPSPRRMVLPEP